MTIKNDRATQLPAIPVVNTMTKEKEYICADCGHFQDTMNEPCEKCNSTRVVSTAFAKQHFGEDFLTAFDEPVVNTSLEQDTKRGIVLEEVDKFNVGISSPQGVVIVTDSHSHNFADSNRLPSESLLSIIKNILNCTKIPYIVRAKTQDWVYSGIKNESRRVELWEDSKYSTVTLTLEDDEDEQYYLELTLVSGTYSDLESIFKLEQQLTYS